MSKRAFRAQRRPALDEAAYPTLDASATDGADANERDGGLTSDGTNAG